MAMSKTCPTCGGIWAEGKVQIPEPRGYKVAQRCPVCNGTGQVPPGFYMAIGGTGGCAYSLDPEVCRACGGTMIVWG